MRAMTSTAPARIGRPSGYSQHLAAEICAEIASGLSIRDLTAKDGMPSETTIYCWLAANQPFQEMYARACEQRVEVFAEKIIAIGDEAAAATYVDTEGNTRVDTGAIQAARLRSDNLRWLMAKMAPKKYGDRVEHIVRAGGADQLSDDELARIAAPALLTVLALPAPGSEQADDEQDTTDSA